MASSQPRFKPVENPITDQKERSDSEFMARKLMSIANKVARGARNPMVIGERMLASTISGEIAKELIKGGHMTPAEAFEKISAKKKHPVSESQRRWAFAASERGELPKGKALAWSTRVEGEHLPEKTSALLDQITRDAFEDELEKISKEQ